MFFLNNTPVFFYKEYRFFSIIQFCDLLYIIIPRFCYHEKLAIAGNCRMCLIELNNGIKPVIACATNLGVGMDISLDSLLVKKVRENVLEFLLINHPLDCPICDQGGECDLQDQTLMYGSDRGRFKEMKRSVEDKELGPVVKTIMTRCIHCTRCIRFSEEVLGVRDLGVIGRGSNMEIKMNNLFFLDSELSGNIVDICPVGALTSKPFAFTARPWELKGIETIDLLDSLHSNIRVDIKGNRILRILPRLNQRLNEDWISDFTRFSYESVQRFRIKYPYVSVSNKYLPFVDMELSMRMQWEQCFEFSKIFFSVNKINSFNLFASAGIGLFNINFFYFLHKIIKNSSFFIESIPLFNIDLRDSYLVSSFSNFIKSNYFIFYNLNIKDNFSVFNAKIQTYLNNSFYKKYIFHIGKYVEYSYPIIHLGNSFYSFFNLFRGKSINNSFFFRSLLRNLNISLYSSDISFKSYLDDLNIFDSVDINNLCFFSNYVGYFESGLNSDMSFLSKRKDTLNYFYKTSKVINNIPFIYHGTYLPILENVELGNDYFFLPSLNMFETEDSYINLFGDLQLAGQSLDSSEFEDVRSDFYILKTIFFNFFFFFVSSKEISFISFDYIYNELVFYYLNYFVVFFDFFNFISNDKQSSFHFTSNKDSYFFKTFISNLNVKNSFFTTYSSTLHTFYKMRDKKLNSSFF